jgi:hypothetical protein
MQGYAEKTTFVVPMPATGRLGDIRADRVRRPDQLVSERSL